jgi:hypothetical protein
MRRSKKRGPGQTRRLTGTAWGAEIWTGVDLRMPSVSWAVLQANDGASYPQTGGKGLCKPSRALFGAAPPGCRDSN